MARLAPLLLALAVLLLNDHGLKGAGIAPAWLTGKLSDGAGLYLFPLAVATALEHTLRWAGRPRPRHLGVCVAAAVLAAFGAIKLDPTVNGAVAAVLGPAVLDPTDLLMAPFAVLAAATLEATVPTRSAVGAPAVPAPVAVVAMVACLASAGGQRPRVVDGPRTPRTVDCAEFKVRGRKGPADQPYLEVVVVRSGECPVVVEGGSLKVADKSLAREPIHPEDTSGDYLVFAFPFVFEEGVDWDGAKNQGVLEVDVKVAGTEKHLAFPVELRE